jgi:hypothetical protein
MGLPGQAGTASLASLGTRRAVSAMKDPGTEFRHYRRSSEPAGRDHERLSPLNDLAPQFAPQRHWRPDGGRPGSEGKRAGQRGTAEIFPPDRNCPASVRQQHNGSDLGFCSRVEPRTFSLHRKRSSDRQSKNPPDLRSPLTESNRRPSPYHVSLRSSAVPGRSPDLREHGHTLALTSARQAHASAICHSICHSL